MRALNANELPIIIGTLLEQCRKVEQGVDPQCASCKSQPGVKIRLHPSNKKPRVRIRGQTTH